MPEQEKTNEQPLVFLASSPHIASPVTTQRLMLNVIIALAPVSIFGVVIFGIPALLNIVVAVVSAMGAESLFRRLLKRDVRFTDGSAAVTGLLLALVLPPTTPAWITAMGAIFAVVVAKEFFGGLGANIFNPALAGRAFLLMSFPAAITTWETPIRLIDSSINTIVDELSGATALALLEEEGLLYTEEYWWALRSLVIGNHSGTIGETSVILLFAAFVFLLVTKTIDWRAPVGMLVATFVTSLALGMDAVLGTLTGGVFFAAIFMVTDYVTSPLTDKGKLIFGLGAGVITVLIRKFGDFPEGVTYGILVMNAITPFLNRLIQKKYGFVPKAKGAGK